MKEFENTHELICDIANELNALKDIDSNVSVTGFIYEPERSMVTIWINNPYITVGILAKIAEIFGDNNPWVTGTEKFGCTFVVTAMCEKKYKKLIF